jgi:hypothetical protein
MVVDLLFPGTTNIVANLSSLINQFIDAGLAGLVAFIVVVALFYRPFIVPSSSLSPWASMLSGLLVDRCIECIECIESSADDGYASAAGLPYRSSVSESKSDHLLDVLYLSVWPRLPLFADSSDPATVSSYSVHCRNNS